MTDISHKISELRKQIQEEPENMQAHKDLAYTLLEHEGATAEAEIEFKKVLELDTERKEAAIMHFNLGLFRYRARDYGVAITEFEKAVEDYPLLQANVATKPSLATALYHNLGHSLMLKAIEGGSYDFNAIPTLRRAEECFQKSLEFAQTNTSAQEKLDAVRILIRHGWGKVDKDGNWLSYHAGEGD